MFKVGDRVKIISLEKGVDNDFLNRIGVIAKINSKSYNKYHVEFEDFKLCDKSRYLWWADENLKLAEDEIDNPSEGKHKEMTCLRCGAQMEYLKEYRFDSQDNNRGMLAVLFDYEEHLIFKIYVCPKCRHTEFFYIGKREGLDEWVDFG